MQLKGGLRRVTCCLCKHFKVKRSEPAYIMCACVFHGFCSSTQLLDCFTIPVVVLLSWFFLLVRYKATHLFGAGLCLLGVVCMVGTDVLFGWQQILGKATHIPLPYMQYFTSLYIWLPSLNPYTQLWFWTLPPKEEQGIVCEFVCMSATLLHLVQSIAMTVESPD